MFKNTIEEKEEKKTILDLFKEQFLATPNSTHWKRNHTMIPIDGSFYDLL